MKELRGLRWVPRWTSHLGCVKGCLDHLGVDMSDAWLFGGTGHAFVINIDATRICPSGPTAWRTAMLHRLGRNLGYTLDGVVGSREEEPLADLQQRAWEHVRGAIDRGEPCYGWELHIPEYYVIYGYDHYGYHVSGPGCQDGHGPVEWRRLGDTGIGIVEVFSVRRAEPAPASTIFRDAVAFALEHAREPGKWTFPQYTSGPQAFTAWARAAEHGTAIGVGMAYNAAVWAECRRFAIDFLAEAGGRIPGIDSSALERAIEQYSIVARQLKAVSEAYPFREPFEEEPIGTDARTPAAVEALDTAAEAERVALDTLAEMALSLAEA